MSSATAQLGDVGEFIRGITFKPNDVVPLGTPGSVACLRTKNVQTELDLSDVWALPKEFVKSDDRLVRKGDIIISTANSWNLVGKASWVPELDWETTAGGFVSLLRADPTKVYPRYLYHWIVSDHTQANLRKCSRQTTNISNLSLPQARELVLPLPPLDQQKRIAAILDLADSLRRLRQRALDRLNTLGQAIFYEMFGDPSNLNTLELGALADLKRGPFGGALKKEIFVDSGYQVYEQSHAISKDCGSGRYFIDENKFREMEAFSVRPNDLLVSCSGTLGRVIRLPKNAPQGVINQALLRIRANAQLVLPEYLEAFLESPLMIRFLTGFSRGTGLQNFPPMSEVRKISVPVPSMAQQGAFLDYMSKLRSETQRLEASAKQIQALFESIQTRAFRGEL